MLACVVVSLTRVPDPCLPQTEGELNFEDFSAWYKKSLFWDERKHGAEEAAESQESVLEGIVSGFNDLSDPDMVRPRSAIRPIRHTPARRSTLHPGQCATSARQPPHPHSHPHFASAAVEGKVFLLVFPADPNSVWLLRPRLPPARPGVEVLRNVHDVDRDDWPVVLFHGRSRCRSDQRAEPQHPHRHFGHDHHRCGHLGAGPAIVSDRRQERPR